MESTSRRDLLLGAAAASTASIMGIPMEVLAAAAKAKGGTLVFGSTQKPRHLNSAVQSGIATMMPAAQLFAFPLRMGSDWKPRPYLAERWETSPDGRSITLHLRKDAVFHDGKPITSEDVQFSVETVRDNHPFKTMLAPVNGVTMPDKHTAVIRLAQPHPALTLAMTTSFLPIIPKHVFGDGQNIKRHPMNAKPVGSGPFKLVEWKPGQHLILERFDKFFEKDAPALDRMILREFKDSASLILAFEKGEIDFTNLLVDPRDLARVRKVPGVQIVEPDAEAIGPLCWLAFNTKNDKLKDKRVRQAISYAIDRKFIADKIHGGIHGSATGPIANGSPFHTDKVEHYALNLAKANSLLDAAGMKRGANGTRMQLTVDSIPGVPDMKAFQEYLKPQLAKVESMSSCGCRPTFRPGRVAWPATRSRPRWTRWNWGDPVIGVHRTWISSNIRKGVIWSNTQSYPTREWMRSVPSGGHNARHGQTQEARAELQRIVVDDCPVAFMEWTGRTAYRPDVKNVQRSVWGMMMPFDKQSSLTGAQPPPMAGASARPKSSPAPRPCREIRVADRQAPHLCDRPDRGGARDQFRADPCRCRAIPRSSSRARWGGLTPRCLTRSARPTAWTSRSTSSS
ncbi:MAG: ABC transporter substrate-binding protein [Burkholderiaceae bacterium]